MIIHLNNALLYGHTDVMYVPIQIHIVCHTELRPIKLYAHTYILYAHTVLLYDPTIINVWFHTY